MEKRFDSIDIAKFIAAIFVVAIHSNPLAEVSPLLDFIVSNGIARIAVPFFFITSAFFFFKNGCSWGRATKYCNRLLILYLSWFIVSLPKTIFDRFVCSEYPLGETVFRFVRSFFLTSTFSGSWFIVSCIFCALLFSKLEQLEDRKRTIITIIISVISYLWCVLTSEFGNCFNDLGISGFYKVYELIFAKPYCSIIVGIPYFAMGRYFAKHSEQIIDKVSKKKRLLYIALLLILLLAEVYASYTYNLGLSSDCYLFLLPSIAVIFPLILSVNIQVSNARIFRISSTIIFFSQFMLLYGCEFVEWYFSIQIINFCKFLFAIAFGLLLTWIILKLQNKKGFGWLKYFY